jgi:predicted MPP superfamily phosphohydrolase
MNCSLSFSGRNVTRVEDFWVSVHEMADCTFVSLSLFPFAMPHVQFGFFARRSRELLDAIEAALLGLSRRKPIVLLCHCPINFWIRKRVRSSDGRTFREMIEACNASIFLSGHTHPPIEPFQRTGNKIATRLSGLHCWEGQLKSANALQ